MMVMALSCARMEESNRESPVDSWALHTGDGMRRARSIRLSHLVNIGEKTEHLLQEVGVSTQQELQAIGPVEAWRRIKRLHPEQATLTTLYRLQGALLGVPWSKLPEAITEQLLDELQAEL